MRRFGQAPLIATAAFTGVALAFAATAFAHTLSANSDRVSTHRPTGAAVEDLASAVRPVREARLVDAHQFLAIAAHPNTVILDARPADVFAQGHVAGAVNLPLASFTAESLAALIGDPARPVLIYGDAIQTYVGLYRFGYRNVFELPEVSGL